MTTPPQEQQHSNSFVLLAYDMVSLTKIAMREVSEAIASNPIGQTLLKIIDRVFWTVEKTVQWTTPDAKQKSENQIVTAELIRPLPWILFIPMLIFTRLLSEGMAVLAYLLKKEPIGPSSIVRFVQNTRRSLRVIKYQGLRNIRAKTAKQSWMIARFFPDMIKDMIHWFVEKIHNGLTFQAVKYKNMNDTLSIVHAQTKKTVTRELAKKRRREQSVENPDRSNMLNALLSESEILHNSDSDTDFSLKNISHMSDTSMTSSEEDEQEKSKQILANQNEPEHIIESSAEVHHSVADVIVHAVDALIHKENQPNTSNVTPDGSNTIVPNLISTAKEELLLNGNIIKATIEKINENFLTNEIANNTDADRNTSTSNKGEIQSLQEFGKDIDKIEPHTDKAVDPPASEIKATQPQVDTPVENKSPLKIPANIDNKPIQNNGTPPKNTPDVEVNNAANKNETFTPPKNSVSPLKGKIFGEDKISPGHHHRPLLNLINHIKEHHNGES